MCSSHHTATGIVHFHNTAMLRRAVAFAPHISHAGCGPGRPRRVSASAQQGHVDAARRRSLWQTCTQEVKKHRQAWLLGALGSLGCLVYVCCTDTFQVWWTSGLAEPFTPGEKAPYVRDVVTEKAEVLRRYVKEFDKKRRGCFVLVAGPESSGKTTCIEKAFDGWKGVRRIEVDLDATPPESYHARQRVKKMDDYCRKSSRSRAGTSSWKVTRHETSLGRSSTSVETTPTTIPRVPSSSRRQCPRYVLPQSVLQTARANRSQTSSRIAGATSAERCTSLP